jgi:hypothetical protein
MVTLVCQSCSVIFQCRDCDVPRRRFCGRECFAKYRKTLTGNKAFMYGKKHSETTKRTFSMKQFGKTVERCNSFKGGTIKTKEGYMEVLFDSLPKHEQELFLPMKRNKSPYVMEHRLVMARKLGRPLQKWEVVHHKNGIRVDNVEHNLQLYEASEHRRQHWDVLRRMMSLKKENEMLREELRKHGIQPPCDASNILVA